MKITVGDYEFALGEAGVEFQFKFTTETVVNEKTIIRIYVPDEEFVRDLPSNLSITNGASGTISQYDSTTKSIKISNIWTTKANSY